MRPAGKRHSLPVAEACFIRLCDFHRLGYGALSTSTMMFGLFIATFEVV